MSTNQQYDATADEARLTAYALGELSESEVAALESELDNSRELREELNQIRAMAGLLGEAFDAEPELELTASQRAAIIGEQRAQPQQAGVKHRKWTFRAVAMGGTYASAAAILVAVGIHFFGESDNASSFTYGLFGNGGSRMSMPASVAGGIDSLGYGGGFNSSLEGLGYLADSAPAALQTEDYAHIRDNSFRSVHEAPLSTLSIDVDTASYANVRRFLTAGQLPPPDAVRIEELLNYFSYDYPAPTGSDPFSIDVEVASAPWTPDHRLVRIGLRGREISFESRRPTNLVFLLDVSGSMSSPDKLPLVKQSLQLLVEQLDERDHVSIAVYAGAAGLVLPPTPGSRKSEILSALERLNAGGSTNGGEGIQLAYKTARQDFDDEGINRVILCTDGDFNIGTSSAGALVRLIERQAKSGVELSVLGFGSGNLQDSKMEQLADKGNGNYSYIDRLSEARKVLVEEMGGTLVTIAKDVKIQVEFNPIEVQSYRLIGYENRLLNTEDFNDDSVDAGEIGAGHTVTALYEVVPVGAESEQRNVDPLKYQNAKQPSMAAGQGELLTVKLRYKQPRGSTSLMIETTVRDSGLSFEEASADLRFAGSVAGFGMLLRKSEHRGSATLKQVQRWAIEALGGDRGGYRSEFIGLVAIAMGLNETSTSGRLRDLGYADELEKLGYSR